MLSLFVRMYNLLRREEGQGLVEYGLIIGLVAIAVVGALVALQGGLDGVFGEITDALNDAPAGPSS